jgi:hypothetical protein
VCVGGWCPAPGTAAGAAFGRSLYGVCSKVIVLMASRCAEAEVPNAVPSARAAGMSAFGVVPRVTSDCVLGQRALTPLTALHNGISKNSTSTQTLWSARHCCAASMRGQSGSTSGRFRGTIWGSECNATQVACSTWRLHQLFESGCQTGTVPAQD